MKMFVQNVVIPEDEDEDVVLPLPVDHSTANVGEEEDALPMPALHFSANRRKRGPTNLPLTECDECGFRFTPGNSGETEINCPRCGTTVD